MALHGAANKSSAAGARGTPGRVIPAGIILAVWLATVDCAKHPLVERPRLDSTEQRSSDTEFLITALSDDGSGLDSADLDGNELDEASARAAVAFVRRCGTTVPPRVADRSGESSNAENADRRLTLKPN